MQVSHSVRLLDAFVVVKDTKSSFLESPEQIISYVRCSSCVWTRKEHHPAPKQGVVGNLYGLVVTLPDGEQDQPSQGSPQLASTAPRS